MMVNLDLMKSPRNWLFVAVVFAIGILIMSISADMFNGEKI